MMIERFKGIGAYIADKTGVCFSEGYLRRLAARDVDPLPVQKFLGRATASEADLDAWISRQWHTRGAARRRVER